MPGTNPRMPTSRNTAATTMAKVRASFSPRAVPDTPTCVLSIRRPLSRHCGRAGGTPRPCEDAYRRSVRAPHDPRPQGHGLAMSTRAPHTERPSPDAGPEDAPKVESPTDLTKPSWVYVLRKTVREFSGDQCTDLAAALTYYGVLALFPAAIALTSLLGLVGQGTEAGKSVLDIATELGGGSVVDSIRDPMLQISRSQSAGLTLVVGLLGALWSASGYVGAFGRAMNRIYEIDEGRPFWKLRPVMLLVTVVAIVLVSAVLLMLIVSGPLARSIGDQIGLGDQAVQVW